MWLWLVPAAALAVGVASERFRPLRPLIVASLCLVTVTSFSDVVDDDQTSYAVGSVLNSAVERGAATCGIGYSAEPFSAYANAEPIWKLADLDRCVVVVAHPAFETEFRDLALSNEITVVDGFLDRYMVGWTDEADATVPALADLAPVDAADT